MKRWAFGLLVASAIGVGLAPSLGGCDDGGDDQSGYGGGGWADCEQYTTCGACTPVPGCGWCEGTDGTGLCAGDPNACAGAQQFSWTWDPTGCRVTADASVVVTVPDAGGSTESGGGDAGRAADAAVAADASGNTTGDAASTATGDAGNAADTGSGGSP